MANYLPDGIITSILHRLPVKSLLRCTAVSKSWYALIHSPQFISSHLKFSATNTLLLRRCIRNSERYDLFSDSHNSLTPFTKFEFPFTSMNSFFTIVGICNGLLCLSDDRVYYMNTIVIWNPSIKKSVLLPKPNLIYNSFGTFVQCLGFGFDCVGNDYKVVRITYLDCVKNPQIEVYRLSTGVWQDLSYLGLDYVVYNRSWSVFVNGGSHWIARCMAGDYDSIVLFDMCGEVFRTMMLPFSLVGVDRTRSTDLVVFREALGLISLSLSGSVCVWVMEEYGVEKSWTRILSFDLGGVMRPLWVRGNGDVILVREDGHLMCCDGDGEVKDVGIGGLRAEEYRRSVHVERFTSSLVLLERKGCNNLPTMRMNDSGSDYEQESGSDSKQNRIDEA